MTDSAGARISELRGEILALDARLAAIVAYPEEGRGGGGRGGARRAHSPAPWHAGAALCRMDLHALAREVEGRWREMAGFGERVRGGSDSNTCSALEALGRLCEARGVEVRGGVRDLERWARGARIVLGDLERPRRVAGVACPFCAAGGSLRMIASRGAVICVNPACRTEDGGKAMARMEWVADTETVELVWSELAG